MASCDICDKRIYDEGINVCCSDEVTKQIQKLQSELRTSQVLATKQQLQIHKFSLLKEKMKIVVQAYCDQAAMSDPPIEKICYELIDELKQLQEDSL